MVTGRTLYLALLGAVALQRLLELRLSRHNARASCARGGLEIGRGHFPAMAALHAGFLLSCALEVLLLPRRFPGALGWIALLAFAVAQALRLWAISTLGPRWSVRIIVLPGEAPVTAGPYRFLRHPNYLAVALEIVSLPLVHGAFLTAAAFSLANAVLLGVRIRAEERALGAAWRDAFASVPRFVPRVARG